MIKPMTTKRLKELEQSYEGQSPFSERAELLREIRRLREENERLKRLERAARRATCDWEEATEEAKAEGYTWNQADADQEICDALDALGKP